MPSDPASTFRKISLVLRCSGKPELIIDPQAAGNADNVLPENDLPVLFLGETVIFCLTCVDEAGNAMVFDAGDSFVLSGDTNYEHDDDLLIYSAGSGAVNAAGDWSEASPANGKISIRAVCGSGNATSKIGTGEMCSVEMQLRRIPAGGTAFSVLMSRAFPLKNIILSGENEPAAASVGYYTAAQVDSLLSGIRTEIYAVPQYQYSADGETNWHSQRAGTDFYYRTSADGTAWGPAIPMGRFGVIVDNINYAFSTTENQASAVTFLKTALGIAADSEPQLSLWSVVESGGAATKTQINTAGYTAAWASDSLTITYYTTWPAGDWIIKLS